jgi:hypothetical protein
MSCPTGKLINVTCAFYGRANTFTCFPNKYCKSLPGCSVMQNTQCSSATVLNALRTQCNSKQTCNVNIDGKTTLGGDPCQGTLKYAVFSYICA